MPWIKRHRERKSPRLKGWNYSQTAAYFITICTQNREPFFGDVRKGIMGLSHQGIIAHWFWLQIPHQFPHVALDEFIIMPNHMHGILTIYNTHRDAINRVPMEHPNPRENRVPMGIGQPKQPGGATGWHNPMLSNGNLGQVIRWYKGRCTFEIHKRKYPDFKWQGRYWDHIIQNEASLNRIRKYIYDNPRGWRSDRYYGKK